MVALRFVLTLALAVSASVSAAQGVELLDFYLPTCGPCQAMAPTVAQLESQGVRVRGINGSRWPGLAQRFGVTSYPTFVAVADGRELGRRVGMTTLEDLRGLAAPAATTRPVNHTFAPTEARGETFAAVGADWGAGRPAPIPTAAVPGGERLLSASVRLTVDEGGAVSYGTGTIVDARSGEALVVTCAHLFLDESRRLLDTNGHLTIELFDAAGGAVRVAERVEGQVITHDAEADVALVAIRPRGVVQKVAVAASPGSLAVGDPLRSVGCDLGADPTVREHRVVDLNRYEGPPNTEASGAPTQGRSGGGLFNAAGQLVGVCNFADEAADEGIYAGLASIHAQLDKIGMSDLYRAGGATPPPAAEAFAAAPPVEPTRPSIDLTPIPRTPVLRGQGADPIAPADARLTTTEQATLDEIVRRGERASITVVIHPEGGGSQVLTLDSASPEFVSALRKLSEKR